jgi:riboflavin transporter 2
MARFQGIYLTSFFIGEGLSGFVPSIFALIQGVGGNPECQLVNVTVENSTEVIWKLEAVTPDPVFTIETFFYFLFGTMLTSAIAYHLLTYWSITKNALSTDSGRKEGPTEVLLNTAEPPASFYQSTSPTNSLERMRKLAEEDETSFEDSQGNKRISIVSSQHENGNANVTRDNSAKEGPKECRPEKAALFTHVSKSVFIYLLVIQALVCCFANGVFPSIQSYSCLPYGNVAYHWAVTLSTMANPAVCFMLFVLPKPTQVSISTVCAASIAVAGYCFATAVMSPNPPLVGAKGGEALLVSIRITFVTWHIFLTKYGTSERGLWGSLLPFE